MNKELKLKKIQAESQRRLERLQNATPERLLEAAIIFYSQFNPDCEQWLRLGFALARPNGWERVAPMWLEDLTNSEG